MFEIARIKYMNRLCFLIILLVLFPTLTSAGDRVVLANDPWPPYVLGKEADGTKAAGGIAVELIRVIFDRVEEADAEILLIPWRRALDGVGNGTYDGIPLLFKTKKREEYMEFSAPLFKARTVFFYKTALFPQGISWKTFEDLTKYTIAVQDSFSIAEKFDEQIAKGVKLNLNKMNTDEECFRMLSFDRVDLVVTNEIVGREFLKKMKIQNQVSVSLQSLYDKSFHIGFSKKTEARKLIPVINKAVNELRAEGAIDKVLGGN
jgi:polar amino acid transport system substrate-binding protein